LMVLKTLKSSLPVDDFAVEKSLKNFSLAGRFQMLSEGTQTILDVAHNNQSAKMLVHNLKQLPNSGKTHIIIGMLKDKDRISVLGELMEIADYWHTVTISNPRGSDSETIRNELLELGVSVPISMNDTVADVFLKIQDEMGIHDRIVVTGSFLTVGDAIKHLGV